MTETELRAAHALDALRRAVAAALEEKRRAGHYAIIWQDGEIVKLDFSKNVHTPPPTVPPA